MNKPPDPYKTNKTSLKSIVRSPEIQEKLMDVVLTAHNMMRHTTQFLKLYLLHCYETKKPIPELTVTFLVNVMKCLCIKTENRGKKPSDATLKQKAPLIAFFKEHYAPLMTETITYTHMANIMSYLAQDILTSYENNIKQNFVSYIERFVNVYYDHKEKIKTMTKEEKHMFMNGLRKIKVAIMDRTNEDIPQDLQPHIPFLFPNRKLRECLRYDLKCSPQDYIPCMIHMMKFVEAKEKIIFKIFPLRTSMIPNYVPLDTATVIQLFVERGKHCMNKGQLLTNGNLVKYQSQIWSWFFQTHKGAFKHKEKEYSFAHRIVTDGEGVSILFETKTPVKESKKVKDTTEAYLTDFTDLSIFNGKNPIAVDPGHSDLIFCNGKNLHGEMQHFRYTQDQRRKETKANKYRNIHQELKKKTMVVGKTIEAWETELSAFNSKTVSFAKFQEYIKLRNAIYQKVHSFYEQKVFLRLKWYSFINRKRTEQRMINHFQSIYGKPEDAVVFFGDYEQFKHRKYREPVIGKGLRTIFRKAGYTVILVDEFRTSCTCFACNGECETFRKCNNPKPWKKDTIITRHGLLSCKNCSRLWNRDVNGSLNIHRIVTETLEGKGRPFALTRGTQKGCALISGATSATSGDKTEVSS
ncbi:MAG: hypothetical protein VKK05_08285 [Synechococcus sp.]|nr:hypothetical protein [Synechococcus sp.]